MLSTKDKAATSAQVTAKTHNRQNQSYRNRAAESRAKLEIGKLLLYLQTPLSQEQKKKCWQLFESKLRRYIDLRYREICCEVSQNEKPEQYPS